jgi:hypothetical protein
MAPDAPTDDAKPEAEAAPEPAAEADVVAAPTEPAAPAEPVEPVSPLKEWGLAVALMLVFSLIAAQVIMFLRN